MKGVFGLKKNRTNAFDRIKYFNLINGLVSLLKIWKIYQWPKGISIKWKKRPREPCTDRASEICSQSKIFFYPI